MLKRLKKPVSIISDDWGIIERVSIFNAFVSDSKKYNPFYKEMHNLLMSVGISVYTNLNNKMGYYLFGKTKSNNLTYNLRMNDKSTSFFHEISNDINSLEQGYENLFMKSTV